MHEDLFTIPDGQLHRPGQETSAAALEKTGKARANRQRRVFEALKNFPAGTIPEQVAVVMKLDLIDVRRCFSVLKRLGKIEPTGEVRKNYKDNDCEVWRVSASGVPQVKRHRMKPVGNPILWGEVMRTIYAHAKASPEQMMDASMNRQVAACKWSLDMAHRIGHHIEGNKPDWMTAEEWAELSTISGAYGFHD